MKGFSPCSCEPSKFVPIKMRTLDKENRKSMNANVTTEMVNEEESTSNWRRKCGCIRTSDKLKQILKTFPSPPPPTPDNITPDAALQFPNTCISAYCTHMHQPAIFTTDGTDARSEVSTEVTKKMVTDRSWHLVADLVQLIQLSVTATALALYYLIYCYMQLVYYTLRSALYFHHADGPMKITIGVVTLTSLVVGFNLILRMERLIEVFF
ncbi:hypothetical protein O3G_MSEX006442 [Manduca sexta]|uniref:Uncharacterized protein n=1 Tax=Manduca sexta TaxID=7130 RepID=A0A922CL09_MANSE|nr:hypothetical protein O3G_MSEX006442 [Manduca sexta]